MKKFVSGLRFRLVLLVVLVCAPLVGLMLRAAWEDRRHQVAGWLRHSQEMMQLATQEEVEVIGQTRQLLRAVAESSQVRSGNRWDCKQLLDELFASYPRYLNLGVIKTNGDFLASAIAPAEPGRQAERGAERLVVKATPVPIGPASQADREFFRRVLETRAFAIGDFQVGRTNGKPAVSFGEPVLDPSGQVQAVVFASLELDWFESEVQAQLPTGAIWTQIDHEGRVLVRYPAPEEWIGRPFPETSLLQTVFSRNQGVVEALDSAGVPSLYAFASMRSQFVPGEVVAVLGIPRHILFAGVDRRLASNLAGLAVAVGLVLVFAWISSRYLVLRPVEALVKTSARLAAGDLSARTGLRPREGELGQLTRTFDQMAQTLEQREAERQRADKALQASEMRYRRLFESAKDGILILNADTGQIEDVNPFLTGLLGYSREQLLGKELWEIGPFKDIQASRAEFRKLQQETSVRYEDLPLETGDGRSISVEFVSNVYPINGGKVVQCNIRDITERKRADARLRLQSSALESAANAIAITDRAGTVSWANSAFLRLTGYTEAEVRGANLRLLKSDQQDAAFFQNLWQTILQGQVWQGELTNRRKNGSLYVEENTITPVRDERGEITHFIAVKQDITQRKQTEEKLKEYSNNLEILSLRLLEAQESERRHIARELHDEIGQALTVAQLNLQAMLQLPDTDARASRLRESLEVIERVLEQVHDISLNLRPPMLDDLGLEPALRWYTHRQAALTGLRAEVRADLLEQRLDPVIETACFRVAQEALTNVARHAQARAVTVKLRRENGRLHLRVRDDGVGFDVAAVRKQAVGGDSLGLLSMEERTVLAGGELEFKSNPGKGTEVHAWFPLKWARPADLSAAI